MTIALFFGSFNPIHNGHLHIAKHIIKQFNFDEIWFIVSPQNPLKLNTTLLDENERLKLVNLATEQYPNFKSCNVEFSLPKPSYTIHTLNTLSLEYPNYTFSIIIGEDNASTLPYWKDYQSILNQYKVYVYPRIHQNNATTIKHPNIIYTNFKLLNISSTEIRHCIQNKQDVSMQIPEKVHHYCIKHQLFLQQ